MNEADPRPRIRIEHRVLQSTAVKPAALRGLEPGGIRCDALINCIWLPPNKKRGSECCPSVELTNYIFERAMPPPIPPGIFIVPLIQSSGLFG
jgi:hypothetical protein